MTYEETLAEMEARGIEAHQLIEERVPGVTKRFERIDKMISNLMREVEKEFPDANYYTSGGDGFALLLGPSHCPKSGRALQDLAALHGMHARINGGDW